MVEDIALGLQSRGADRAAPHAGLRGRPATVAIPVTAPVWVLDAVDP
ncbi:hypothetical protein ACLMAL_21400 [Nocardia sp. CWNU-33]